MRIPRLVKSILFALLNGSPTDFLLAPGKQAIFIFVTSVPVAIGNWGGRGPFTQDHQHGVGVIRHEPYLHAL